MKNSKQRIVFGSVIIGIGILAFLDKLNLFQIGHFFQFWPTVFIVAGLLKITKAKTISRALTGLGLISFGIILMLTHMGVIHLGWHDLWPLILIFVGLSIIFKGQGDKCSSAHWAKDVNVCDGSTVDITAIFGGNKTTNNSQDFKGGDINALMGGVELDLRGASLQSDAILDVNAIWGGVQLKIPSDWTIVNKSAAILGAVEDKSIPSANSTKRLIITGTAIMGGVDIKN
jgi:predicted membrane protein